MTGTEDKVGDSSRRLLRVVVVGGGAAGFFAAIACAEALRGRGSVTVLERGPQFLQKVKISGGGRCNVTHACFEPKELAKRYPRGGPALIGALHRFQAADTVQWFATRGVELKTEADGRMFPTTDQSQTIIECLTNAARDAGVELRANCGVERVERRGEGGFRLTLAGDASGTGILPVQQSAAHFKRFEGSATALLDRQDACPTIDCDLLLLATGGCRAAAAGSLATSLGHTLEPPVPSLFTFHVTDTRLDGIAGVAVENAVVSVAGTKLKETGPVLVTHWGLSGPAIIRLSAWGARDLHGRNYQFPLRVNWLPGQHFESALALCQRQREKTGAKLVVNAMPGAKTELERRTPVRHGGGHMAGQHAEPEFGAPLPARLWEKFVAAAGISATTQWARLDRAQLHALARQLTEAEFAVTNKSLNKDEFVTCGGVRLAEVDFKTMASRACPGLYFAGELLDIDGITGGFNFQAAWTTGWIAGQAMAESLAAAR
ncbi:MAG: NAD(P)/FAD-dependent oxidoreductase [Verrucomicrobia bacterium]|nr:NAD(P)/FAD-dependent oxidoreductase [Verrucomicrobiota bacterium]